MLYSPGKGTIGARTVNAYITLDAYILAALLAIASIATIYLSGRIAQRRGRSFKNWAWIAGMLIGPLALSYFFELIKMYREEYLKA